MALFCQTLAPIHQTYQHHPNQLQLYMKLVRDFVNLFHRKQRFKPEYQTLSSMKKYLFLGVTGFVVSLSFSKFIQANLIYSFEPTEENKMMIKLNPALQRKQSIYTPNILMIFGIFQRLYAKYRQQQPYFRVDEQNIDGDIVQSVYLHDKAKHKVKGAKKGIPLVFIIAGSQGIDNTIKHLMSTAYNLGYRTIVIDPKDLFNKEKIKTIIMSFKEKYPKDKTFGIGVEYGANLLINVAAQYPTLFEGLVSVGNPFNLAKSEIKLQNSWIWKLLYRDILSERIKKGRQLNKKLNPQQVQSLFELDKFIYNIEDQKLMEWKQKNSSINSIHKLKVNTLLLQSNQDPFTQKIENDERFQNEKCIYITTKRGGHNQWFQNIWMNRWFVTPIRYFLKLVNEEKIVQILEQQKLQQLKAIP